MYDCSAFRNVGRVLSCFYLSNSLRFHSFKVTAIRSAALACAHASVCISMERINVADKTVPHIMLVREFTRNKEAALKRLMLKEWQPQVGAPGWQTCDS